MSSPAPALPSPCLYPTFACLFSNIRESDLVKSYDGYQVYRLNITSQGIFNSVKNLFLSQKYDFWSPPSMEYGTDVMVPPRLQDSFKKLLSLIGVPYEMMYNNLKEAIDYEKNFHIVRGEAKMSWDMYQSLETIHGWMDSMGEQYPAIVTVTNYGKSTEGRPMKVMKISSGGPNSTKPAIWLDGGIHAREWISPATVSYIANELILQATRKRNSRMIEMFDYYVVPVMNPDGYTFTMSNDRMWRKTRSPPKSNGFGSLFGFCKGADPNRNWDYEWGGKGTSGNQCSQIFHGEKPGSEPEVSATQDYIMGIKDNLKLFLTFHSYSQLLLLPWGYDNKRTDDYEELAAVGGKALAALEAVYGTKYKYGATAELLYAAAGGSFDWAKGVAGVKYSYAFELRDTGKSGFILPPSNIIPSGIETFAAVKSMAEDISKIYKIGSFSSPLTVESN